LGDMDNDGNVIRCVCMSHVENVKCIEYLDKLTWRYD